MTFWVIRYNEVFYQFNTPPDDIECFPYYDRVNEFLEDDVTISEAFAETCDDEYDSINAPFFLKLNDLEEEDIKKVNLVMLPSIDDAKNDVLNKDLKSLDTDLLQYLYEEVSKVANKPYVSNSTELSLEQVREYLVTKDKETLSNLNTPVNGIYPLSNIFRALSGEEIYNTLYFNNVLYSDIEKKMLKNIAVQDMANFISNSTLGYLAALARYLPTSIIKTLNDQRYQSTSEIVDILKRLLPPELNCVIDTLPIDTIKKLQIGIENRLKVNNTSHNTEQKVSLISKLKNNKLL